VSSIVKNRIYISGPIIGIEMPNVPFIIAAHAMEAIGKQPIVPVFLTAFDHPDFDDCPVTYRGEGHDHDASCYMRACLEALVTCDSMLMLEGWMHSRGAVLEHDIAIKLGMDIYYQDHAQRDIGVTFIPGDKQQ
jgi:hypothetical protein